METLLNNLPDAKDLLKEREKNKQHELSQQTTIILEKIKNLTTEEEITLDFPIVNELRNALYRKGYNTVVNGNLSTISIRDPKEDVNDEWTTFDCGGN